MESVDLEEMEVQEKERFQNHDMRNQLHDLEMKFRDLATLKNKMIGSKKKVFKQEMNAIALKHCCREAREEISEMRTLLKEQNDELKDCRAEHLKAEQMLEEQRRLLHNWNEQLEANEPFIEDTNLEIQQTRLMLEGKLAEQPQSPDEDEEKRMKEMRQKLVSVEQELEQCKHELICKREKVDMLQLISQKSAKKAHECVEDEKKLAMIKKDIDQIAYFLDTIETKAKDIKSEMAVLEKSALALGNARKKEKNAFGLFHYLMDYFFGGVVREWQAGNESNQNTRKAMETNVEKLERKLAATRSDLKAAEKGRREALSRIQHQVKRLNQQFKDAQPRFLALQLLVKK